MYPFLTSIESLQVWVSLLMLLNMGVALTAEFTAVGDLYEIVIGAVRWPIVVIIALVSTIYTAYGGLHVSIITDQACFWPTSRCYRNYQRLCFKKMEWREGLLGIPGFGGLCLSVQYLQRRGAMVVIGKEKESATYATVISCKRWRAPIFDSSMRWSAA